MSDDIRDFSARLCKVLECAGVSEETRLLYREDGITTEIMDTLYMQIHAPRKYSVYVFGSTSEGTATNDQSDIDTMYCDESLPVIFDLQDAPVGQSLLMLSDLDTKPGYVKLQHVLDGTPCTLSSHDMLTDGSAIDSRGRLCLKHVSHVGEMTGYNQRNGPADTFEVPGRIKSRDLVYALRCKAIPTFASQWVNEIGQHGWPSRQLLDRMKKQGCFVVGKGHPTSDENNIEWRLSFSLQERDIMFDLNPVQHQCYVVLKYVKQDLIQPEIGQSLSSYHCKTALFHVLKATPANMWKPENLVECVMLCLEKLRQWAEYGNCPNFFVQEENMFDGRVTAIARTKLEAELGKLLEQGHRFLYIIQSGLLEQGNRSRYRIQSGKVWKMTGAHIPSYANILTVCKYQMLLNACTNIVANMLPLYILISKSDTPLDILYQHLNVLNTTRTVTEHNEQETSWAVYMWRPTVQLITAKHLACQAFHVHDIHQRRQYRWLSELYLKLGARFDFTQSSLLEASVLYREKQYDMCSLILDKVASRIDIGVMSYCGCFDMPVGCAMRPLEKMEAEKMDGERIPTSVLKALCAAMCIVFLPSEIELIPAAVQYELFKFACMPSGFTNSVPDEWLYFAAVDAKIYLYFMQYLAYSKLDQHVHKQAALDNLITILATDPNLGHKDTAHNLLGWIHTQEGRTEDAFTCFMQSWNIRPGHNAAKWHMGVLVWKCICE